ncbi:MAG: cache domain-containing protein [Deltaproteobacteria bacterium]|nr:cache domain-containing protein [Deltaproteobacteria bacterium]
MSRTAKVKDFFKNLPIRYKLLVVYSSVFTAAIMLCSLTIYTYGRKSFETRIESELKNSTATLINMVRASAGASIKNYLRAVAEKNQEIVKRYHNQYLLGDLTEADAKRMATEVLLSQTIGRTGYLYCLDSRGVLQVHPTIAGKNFSSGFEFLREQMKRKDGYLEYKWRNPGESLERPKALYMRYFAPWDWIISASSYKDEFTSLVNMDDFRESIVSQRFGETGYCFVVDSRGNMIAHPKLTGNQYDLKDADARMFVRDICERKSGEIVYRWPDADARAPRKKLVVFDYIPDFDWIVASSCDLEEIYAPLHILQTIIVVTALATLMLVMFLTFWMSTSLTRPLRKLMDCFVDGAGGYLAARMELNSRDEIGQLAHYFNEFMVRLESSHNSVQAEIAQRKRTEVELKHYQENLEDLVEQRTAELKENYAKLEEANSRIMESIGYARTIQRAILPKRDEVLRHVEESFVIWRPKDVIGGDILWVKAGKDELLLAVIDCTGHGVPGAVMTMIAKATLDRVVHEVGYGDPGLILRELNLHIQRSLHQQKHEARSNDGMDIGICHVNTERGLLTYSGARISLFYGSGGEIHEIKGDRQSIGYKSSDVNYAYANHSIPIDPSMTFYMTTDGLTDQVGSEKKFPFGKRQLINFLAKHHQEPLDLQESLLLEVFEGYKGNEVQRDDIMAVGLRLR